MTSIDESKDYAVQVFNSSPEMVKHWEKVLDQYPDLLKNDRWIVDPSPIAFSDGKTITRKNARKDGMFMPIDKGRSSVIYRAWDVETNEYVAVKFVSIMDDLPWPRPQAHTDNLKLWELEIDALSKINHSNVVRLIGGTSGWMNNCLFPVIVMEYIHGQNFDRILVEDLFSTEMKKEVMDKIAQAIDFCNSQGIIHRDIKPLNILIEEKDNRPVLIDFGTTNLHKMRGYILPGTLGYMSVNQYLNKKPRLSDDVWGYCCSLSHVFLETTPFKLGQEEGDDYFKGYNNILTHKYNDFDIDLLKHSFPKISKEKIYAFFDSFFDPDIGMGKRRGPKSCKEAFELFMKFLQEVS